ncbi:MAG: cytochrome c [Proteobacteria bacterium]|nr:cytochrome c [Pseudomonadota bacterium]
MLSQTPFAGVKTIALVTGVILLTGCEQYDPSSYWQTFKTESETARQSIPTLTDDGAIPEMVVADDAATTEISAIDQKYQTFCATCHGADGKANSAAALALNPVPRDLTDSTWQNSVDDAHITKVIKLGGVAVGLSATMAPWGMILSDEEIQKLVAKIRSWK